MSQPWKIFENVLGHFILQIYQTVHILNKLNMEKSSHSGTVPEVNSPTKLHRLISGDWRFWRSPFFREYILVLLIYPYFQFHFPRAMSLGLITRWFKINITENSLKTNFVQKKMWRFFKDDTKLNCDTKIFVVRKLVILLFFTFSMLSFQNHFCITIKFSIIFKEFSQFLLNIIGIQRIFHNLNFYFFNVIFSESFLYHD